MPQYFNKPENALKRAQEFMEVEKKESALDILAEVMKSKRHRQWNRVHEDIMLMFMDLCVELRRNQTFKEVIHQYKNMTLNVNPSSLIDIVRKYLEQADRKTEEARQRSKAAVSAEQEEVDDLDVIETPESLMMSAVSGETTQDRSDRAILVPWLKFMWESYRQCLDLLRNNNKLERLYHDVAQMAFRFCEKYGRKTEFRKLNDILRSHLGKFQAQLASGQPVPTTGVNLSNPDTQGYHLETRLSQLEFSMNLELYNEAYKSIEDIWNLVTLSKKSPKPSIMANYYTKVALVFWKCGSHLFHAAALHKLFNLHREHKKNMASEELQTMASTVLCATLAIPLPFVRDRHADSLLESGEIASTAKQKMLCSLLGMSIPPSRRSLCADLVRGGIVELAHPELASLYAQLEQRFQPLKLAERCSPGLQVVRANLKLSQYGRPIEDMLICRTLIQAAQVYASITLPRFSALFPFCDRLRLETTVVEAARNLEIPARIDHRRGSLLFGGFSQLGISQREEGVLSDGPSVKTADQLSRQLVLLGSALQGVLTIIQPDKEARAEQRKTLAHKYGQTALRDHQKLLQRKELIEERKEFLENLQQRREEEELMKQRQQQERILQLESERMEKDLKRRQEQRTELEQRNIQLKVKMERIEVLKGTEAGRRAFANLDDANLEEINADEIFAKHVEKERRELQERVKTQEKKLDHLARAKRIEEIPLLTAEYEKRAEEARQRHDQVETERIRALQEQHTRLLQLKREAKKIMPFKVEFEEAILAERRAEFERCMEDWRQRLESARKQRLAERKAQRERQRREEFVRQRLAELAAQREAKELAAREEKERQMQEENKRKQQHYEQQKAKLDEQAKAQAQKEAEIEERLKVQREGGGGGGAGGPSGEKWRPAGGSKWREREKEKEDSFKRPSETSGSWRPSGGGGVERTRDEKPLRRDERSDRIERERRDDRREDRRDERRPDDRPRDDRRDERPRDDRRDDRPRDDRRDERPRDDRRDERPRDDRRDDRPRADRRDERPRDDRRDERPRDDRRDERPRDDRRDDRPRDDYRRDDRPRIDRPRDDRPRDDRPRDDRPRDDRQPFQRRDEGRRDLTEGSWRSSGGGAKDGGSSAFSSSRKTILPRRTADESDRPDAGTPSRRQEDRLESGGWRSQQQPQHQQQQPPPQSSRPQAARDAAEGVEADGWTTVSKKK